MILIGVVGLIVVMVAVGLYVARRVAGDSANLIVAGRTLVLPLAAGTLMAQAVDTNATVGNTDLSSEFGFWAGASLPLGLALCLFLTGLFFAKPLNRMRLTTLPDFYRRKYGRTVEVTVSVIMVLSFTILLAGNLVAGGLLFETFIGTSYGIGVVIIVAVVLSYTIAGGLLADAYTDVIKVAITFVGAFLLIGYIGVTYGLDIPEGKGPFDLEQLSSPAAGAYVNWATLLALGLGDIVALDFMERVFAARSPETARRACFIGAGGTVLIGVPFALVALGSPAVLQGVGAPPGGGPVLFQLLEVAVPAGIALVVLGGIVAAGLSTADGAILGSAAVVARNLAGLRGRSAAAAEAGERDRLLTATRLGMIPIALLGVFFALRVPETGVLLTLAFDLGFAGLLAPLVLGLYWPRANAAGALAGIVAGTGTRLLLFVLTPTIFGADNTLLYVPNDTFGASFDGLPTLISPLVGLVAFVAVSLATQRAYVPVAVDRSGA